MQQDIMFIYLIGDKHLTRDIINGRQTLVEGKETYKEIAIVEIERNIRYYSFNNLGKIDQQYPHEHMRHGLIGYSKDYLTGKIIISMLKQKIKMEK